MANKKVGPARWLAALLAAFMLATAAHAQERLTLNFANTDIEAVGRGEQVITQVFKLNYESAVSIAAVLRPLVASNNPINAYAGNNTIVVTDYAENVRRIARIIAAIDTPSSADIDVVRLENTIASDMAALLARLLEAPGQAGDQSGRVTILAEPTTNSLLIRAPTAARASLVRTLVTKLDQPSAAPGNIHVVYLKNANATVLARTLLGVAAPPDSGGFGTPGQNQHSLGSPPAGTPPPTPP